MSDVNEKLILFNDDWLNIELYEKVKKLKKFFVVCDFVSRWTVIVKFRVKIWIP